MEQKKELRERLEILRSAGMIEDEVVKYCEEVLKLLYQKQEVYAQEPMEIFVTHLAMAMHRVLKNESEEDVDAMVLEALQHEPVYNYAEKLLKQMVAISDITIPVAEQHLLLIHLCNICSHVERRTE